MKKVIIILTALTLLIAIGVFFVQADADTVYCERCNQDVSADNWQDWNFTGGDVTGGHYRLTDDFFDQTQVIRIPENNIVCLDLNGHTYATTKIRLFNVMGTFTIMDSVGGGTFLSTGENAKYGGFALVQSSGTVHIYGGTIRHSALSGVSPYTGGLFYVDGGTINMHDGVVAGGTVKATSSYNSSGGNFTVTNSGRLNIYGGTVTQGVALKSSSKTAQGGNIYATNGSKVVIDGAVIEGGYSDAGGGNIFVAEGTLEVRSGTIRNGHALVSGGNIMANANTNVVNTVAISGGTITGGVAGGTYGSYTDGTFARGTKGGGNIYERSPAGILTISGGTIDGDIVLDYVKTMTLSGTPKIGLGKSGGLVFTNVGSFKANVNGLMEGAEIYVQSSRVFTTAFDSTEAAQAALAYFKGAVRTAVSANTANALQGTQGTQGYCPHCGELVTWKNLNTDATLSGHSYLSSSLVRTGNLSISSEWVLDLNGYTLHQENRRFIFNYNSQNISLTILDSWAGGKIQGTGTGNAEAGLLYIWPNSTFELLSGTLRLAAPVNSDTPTDIIVKTGGIIFAGKNATVNISGGVISNGVVTATDGYGGNIAMTGETGTLHISAGIIAGGNADALSGGNIYSNAPVNITGGVIMGGSAKNGGNIYTKGSCTISGGLMLNGNATNYGGNHYIAGSADISNGMIAFGTATTAGGNIGVYGGETNISGNATIVGGNAPQRGGNIAAGSTGVVNFSGGLISTGSSTTRGGNVDTATETAHVNITGGQILLGAAANGGNLYINNGHLNMTSGVVAAGNANNGGNLYMNYYVYATIKDDADSKTQLPRISHGKATSGNGGNIYLTAATDDTKYYLQIGNCQIREGSASGAGNNIYAHDKGTFTVLTEFAGQTTISFHESRNPVKGGLLTNNCTSTGNFSGSLQIESIESMPYVCAESGRLRITAAAVIMKDGTANWFGNNEDAVKNYTDGAAYMIADAGEIELNGGNYVVDLSGQEIAFTGTGTVSCFDSANDNFVNFGTATVNGPILTNLDQFLFDGKTYITLTQDGAYNFHRISMSVDSVSIRPANAGIYYTCTWNCDNTLSENVESFGVALSLDHMPGANFMDDKYVLYTRASNEEFVAGTSGNSVLVANVLKQSNQANNDRARMEIYATPYVLINGQDLPVIAKAEDQAQRSMYDVIKYIDEQIANDPLNYRKMTLSLREFYETWKNDGMQDWNLIKIPTPPEDDVIDVLMIGSSFCYYYVEELYGLAEAAGVKMRVCNVYYSGCKFEWHYTWWKQGKSNYEFYQVTDNTGRRKTSGVSLEYCLAQGEWDVISIQESTSTIYNAGAQNHLNTTRDMRTVLLGYLKEQFPSAQVYWHQPWSYQIGYKSGNTKVETYEQQQERMLAIREFAIGVTKENGVKRVNTGEAWQIYRKNYVGKNGLTDTLCARLGTGTNDVGDYYHDGDIGGGQYLNACVWFETIMKDLRPNESFTCIGNTYSPTYGGKYTLSQELRTALQESAHQAVLDRESGVVSTEEQ